MRAASTSAYPGRGALVLLEARSVLDRADAEGSWPSDHVGVQLRAAIPGDGASERLP